MLVNMLVFWLDYKAVLPIVGVFLSIIQHFITPPTFLSQWHCSIDVMQRVYYGAIVHLK